MCPCMVCRWQDDYPDSWEPEESVSADIIAIWEQQRQPEAQHAQQGSSTNNGNGSPVDARQLESAAA